MREKNYSEILHFSSTLEMKNWLKKMSRKQYLNGYGPFLRLIVEKEMKKKKTKSDF